MKIAIISDIHANLEALSAVVATLDECDSVFLLGDIIGYGAEPNSVVEKVKEMRPSQVLSGNHEYAVTTGDLSKFHSPHGIKAIEWTRDKLTKENHSYLSSLSPSFSAEAEGVRIAGYHGSPRDPLNEYVYPITPKPVMRTLLELSRADVLLLGHSHIPMQIDIGSGLIVNPGSVGQPRDGDPRASYGILEVSAERVSYSVRRVKYDVYLAARKIFENNLPRILGDRLIFGF
jgi:putative phosphoesterase